MLTTYITADRIDATPHCPGKKCHGKKCRSDNSVNTNTSTTEPINANNGCPCTEMIADMSIYIDWDAGRAHYWYEVHARPRGTASGAATSTSRSAATPSGVAKSLSGSILSAD